ncbi:MAG: (2Fe-2S) ferredoxin domain-containing protein [Pseudomonadota bacterium]|nr:(2Fe-2S) ferredoxin domain-containing protein [Pseudomonadota bacterium]
MRGQIFQAIRSNNYGELRAVMDTSYYKYHVFFCTNQRIDGRPCCQDCHAAEMRSYMKKRIKEEDLSGVGKVRVNTAGCLDRCDLGPVMVIYPQAVWYTYLDEEDIDEIIDSLVNDTGQVERLLIN